MLTDGHGRVHRDLRVSRELGESATATDLTVITSEDVRRAYSAATQQS